MDIINKIKSKYSWLILLLLIPAFCYAWTGVYTYNIDVSGILAAGYIYRPYTIHGEVWNEDIPIYSYTIEFREGAGVYEELQTVVVEGQNIYEGRISSIGRLDSSYVDSGSTYELRIYCTDYDSNVFVEPTTWVFDVREGVLPPEEISR
jgi:hypothetical protein